MPNYQPRRESLDLNRCLSGVDDSAKAILIYTRIANDLLSINEAASALAMGSSSKEKREEMTARLTAVANQLSSLLENMLSSDMEWT